MNKVNWRILVGVILLVMGGLTLLQSLDVLKLEGSIWGIVFAAMFIAGGAAFLYVFFADRAQWWALIPGGIDRLFELSSHGCPLVGE